MSKSEGFSLIELLIVVAVIGIIAALAVPNLVQSRKAANEASAIASVRNLVTAQITYASTLGGGNFGSLAELSSRKLHRRGPGEWPEGRLRRFSCRQRIDRIQRVIASSNGPREPRVREPSMAMRRESSATRWTAPFPTPRVVRWVVATHRKDYSA